MANDEIAERADWLARWVEASPTGTGALDGAAVAVKEIVAIGGAELSANTDVVLPDRWRLPADDAVIVARLRSAGARIVATTTTHELAWGITTHAHGRRVRHPHHPRRIAGGSSGGSAVAVALRAVELAVGTDTAGSVRIPAAWCGVFGWKAGRDAVPTDGVLPLAPRFDHVGLLTADVSLLARAVGAVAAPGGRIERLVVVHVEDGVADERAWSAVDVATSHLESTGLPVDPSSVVVPVETVEAFGVVQRAEALRAHAELIGTWPGQAARYSPQIRERLELAERTDPSEVAEARERIDELHDVLRDGLRGAVAVLPATGCAAPSVDTPDQVDVAGRIQELRAIVLPWTVPANIAGLPAVTVPWQIDEESFGVQLLGGAGSDRHLVELAAALSAAGPHEVDRDSGDAG